MCFYLLGFMMWNTATVLPPIYNCLLLVRITFILGLWWSRSSTQSITMAFVSSTSLPICRSSTRYGPRSLNPFRPFICSGGGNRTRDLQVMSLPSYRCSTPGFTATAVTRPGGVYCSGRDRHLIRPSPMNKFWRCVYRVD